MIEDNLQSVIKALNEHIRDFRGAFSFATFESVYEKVTDELLAAINALAPVVAVVPVPVAVVPATTTEEGVKL